jgi:hypothetical protein
VYRLSVVPWLATPLRDGGVAVSGFLCPLKGAVPAGGF